MTRLHAEYSPSFVRDLKRLDKRHVDDAPLAEVIDLIVENSSESLATLRQRHRMHRLEGGWSGSDECRVCNAGDLLLIWRTSNDIALMQ